MTEGIRDTVIRIKLQEMGESVDMVREHLPIQSSRSDGSAS